MLLQKNDFKPSFPFPLSHLPLSPHSSSLSLVFIQATSQSIYLPNIVLFFSTTICFDCFLVTVRFFVFCYCCLFVCLFSRVFFCFYCCYFLLRLIYCQRSEILRPPYFVYFFQLYELIAHKLQLQLVDEHIMIVCIFILS